MRSKSGFADFLSSAIEIQFEPADLGQVAPAALRERFEVPLAESFRNGIDDHYVIFGLKGCDSFAWVNDSKSDDLLLIRSPAGLDHSLFTYAVNRNSGPQCVRAWRAEGGTATRANLEIKCGHSEKS